MDTTDFEEAVATVSVLLSRQLSQTLMADLLAVNTNLLPFSDGFIFPSEIHTDLTESPFKL